MFLDRRRGDQGVGVGYIRGLATILFLVGLPVVLVTSNVRFAANEGRIYEYGFDKYDAARATGFDRDEISRAGRELRRYFNNDQDTIRIIVNEGGREVSLFNERETAHLRDVKNLFRLTFRAQEIGIVFVLTYVVSVFVWTREGSLRRLAGETLAASLATAAVILGLGAVAITGFEGAFEQFHFIAFDNDLWRLNPRTDHLIQMFPEDFWFDVTLLVGVMTLVEAGVLALASGLYLGFTRPRMVPVPTATGQPSPTGTTP